MWSTRQWINNLVLLNSHHLRFLFHYQHLHHLPLLHNLLLPNSHKQANQKGIISCLLDMRTLILSLCSCSRKKTSSQLQHYPICIWLCTIDCGLPQIPLAYCENTLTSLPLILTPLFPKRTFTELEGLILYLFGHHPHPLFIKMNQSKCLWTGRTLAHPRNQMLRSIIL